MVSSVEEDGRTNAYDDEVIDEAMMMTTESVTRECLIMAFVQLSYLRLRSSPRLVSRWAIANLSPAKRQSQIYESKTTDDGLNKTSNAAQVVLDPTTRPGGGSSHHHRGKPNDVIIFFFPYTNTTEILLYDYTSSSFIIILQIVRIR